MQNKWSHPKPPFPKAFFDELRSAKPNFPLSNHFVITPEERGRGFVVKRGQSVRIVCEQGPQIVDMCVWYEHDRTEHFWNEYTLNREGIFVAQNMRLWSNMPKFRPMMTVIEDTVINKPIHPGARHHYVFGAHCNPHVWYWVTKDKDHPLVRTNNCYFNLIRAIEPFGLGASDLHDNINLFMKCYIDPDTGLHPWEITDVVKGDYVEFYAEMDVLIAVSICPSASGRYSYEEQQEATRPIGIKIYDTGRLLPDYVDPLDL